MLLQLPHLDSCSCSSNSSVLLLLLQLVRLQRDPAEVEGGLPNQDDVGGRGRRGRAAAADGRRRGRGELEIVSF